MKATGILWAVAATGVSAVTALVVQSGWVTGTESTVSRVEGPAAQAIAAPLQRRPQALGQGEGAGKVGRPNIDQGWVRRTAEATGIPEPAVHAYGSAVLALPDGCDLGWTTLAGIGWVESQHGTIDGRTLGADGVPSETILGPALDGEKFAAIPATPKSTALHGNPVWDHALGPLQFIPSTWERWAEDGDGDGVANPHDIDDAAAAAAAYLCHGEYDLNTSKGWNAAVFSYNHENAYVVSVYQAADRYGRAVG